MNLSRRHTDYGLELIVDGRLDAYWADHLSQEIERIIRQGCHHLRLHLGGVQYISSAGIRVLLQFHKQLAKIHGSLAVAEPSPLVRSVIQLTGLEALLITGDAGESSERVIEQGDGLSLNPVVLDAAARMSCQIVGTPAPFPLGGWSPQHSRSLVARPNLFGIGLGALGGDVSECATRFGEWMTVDGTVAYLPSDGAALPDYAASLGGYQPASHLLYGLLWEGQPAWRVRFEAQGGERIVSMSTVLEQSLKCAGTAAAGVVFVAETASLVGAALRQSPMNAGKGENPLAYPEIRQWLRFTPERAFPDTVTLGVGVIAKDPPEDLLPWLRPLGGESGLYGHLHAAAFSYHPLPRGPLALGSVIDGLFGQQSLKGMLHLLSDDRAIQGAGESEFYRGVCWVGPIDRITRVEQDQ